MITQQHLDSVKFSLFYDPDLGIKKTEPVKEIGFKDLVRLIVTDRLKAATQQLRDCEDPEEKARLKKQLPFITPHGTFSPKRKNEFIRHHNDNLLVLDIDNLHPQTAIGLRQHFSRLTGCCLSMVSPRGKGVKAMFLTKDVIPANVKVDNERYKMLKANADKILGSLKLVGFELDVQQFSLHQPFFVSHDAEAFYNLSPVPRIFEFEPYSEPPPREKPKYISVDPGSKASNEIELFILQKTNEVLSKFSSVGTGSRHGSIPEINAVVGRLHYAPHMEEEIKQTLLNGVVSMYGSEKGAKEANAYDSFNRIWESCDPTQCIYIESMIENSNINTTTK